MHGINSKKKKKKKLASEGTTGNTGDLLVKKNMFLLINQAWVQTHTGHLKCVKRWQTAENQVKGGQSCLSAEASSVLGELFRVPQQLYLMKWPSSLSRLTLQRPPPSSMRTASCICKRSNTKKKHTFESLRLIFIKHMREPPLWLHLPIFPLS